MRLNPNVPPKLEEVIQRLLEKDRDLRYQSAADLRSELKRLKRDSDSGRSATHEAAESVASGVAAPLPSVRLGGHRWTLPLGAAGALAVVSGLTWWLLTSRAPDTPAHPIKITPFTTDGGSKARPHLSPDGDKVAYSWAAPDCDNWDVYVKAEGIGKQARGPGGVTEYAIRFLDFDSGEVTVLFRREDPVGRFDLAVSPDERWILYSERPVAQAELILVENLR